MPAPNAEAPRPTDFDPLSAARCLVRLSTATARAQADELAAELERSLQQVAQVLGADLVSIVIPNAADGLDTWLQWRGIGWMDPALAIASAEQARWWARRQQAREEIILDDMDELPLSAKWERAYFAARGVRSLAAVPCESMTILHGYIVVETTRRRRAWHEEQLAFLATFAEVVASARDRAAAQAELMRTRAEAQHASRTKSDFIASLTHEIKTPLTAIMGFAELLGKGHAGELSERAQRFADDIITSSLHLRGIVDDTLNIARADAGSMQLGIQPAILSALLEGAAAQVRLRAQQAGLQLELTLPEQEHEVQVDARKVRQIIINLLVNAIKFTPSGGRVELSATFSATHFEILIKDTGIGIPARDLARMFESFARVEHSDEPVEGAGLGLALVRSLARAHGGEVTVQSAVGVGSTFCVRLPQDARAHGNRRTAFLRGHEP